MTERKFTLVPGVTGMNYTSLYLGLLLSNNSQKYDDTVRVTLSDKDRVTLLQSLPFTPQQLGLVTLAGSIAYGCATEESDIDIRGFVLESKRSLLTRDKKEQWHDRDNDFELYYFNKFITLLENGNPSSIELLGVHPQHILHCSQSYNMLIQNRDLFITKRLAQTFGGFANAQLVRLTNANEKLISEEQREKVRNVNMQFAMERALTAFAEQNNLFDTIPDFVDKILSQIFTQYENTCNFDSVVFPKMSVAQLKAVTSELISIKKTYDELSTLGSVTDRKVNKHASHLVRLYLIAADIFEKGDIITYREKEGQLLTDIKQGKYRNEDGTMTREFYNLVATLKDRFEQSVLKSGLPEVPNHERIMNLQYDINIQSLVE